jgi:hypothetical protein
MQAYETEQDFSYELNERLRMETGWKDVSSGLGRVLFGYGVFLIGTIIGVALVIYAAYGWLFGPGARPSRLPPLSTIWQFYIGLGILSVVGTFGYLIILAGQWKCLHGASERHGARWLMFFCLTTLLAGPVLNISSFIGGLKAYHQLAHGIYGLGRPRFTTMGHYMQLASAACGLLYAIFFLLFLRACARCHNSTRHVMLVNFFLVIVGGLVAISGYLGYLSFTRTIPDDDLLPLYVAAGWLGAFIFYLFLIATVRKCINQSVARVCSPLELT